jgi:hypothetical protein
VLDRDKFWEERKQVAFREKPTVSSINVCIARAPNTKVRILEQLFNVLVVMHDGG